LFQFYGFFVGVLLFSWTCSFNMYIVLELYTGMYKNILLDYNRNNLYRYTDNALVFINTNINTSMVNCLAKVITVYDCDC